MPMRKAHRAPLAWLILAVWLLVSGVAIWLVFHEPYRDFLQDRMPVFEPALPVTTDSRLTVVHFSDENCSCTRFSKPHVEALMDKYGDVNHLHIQPSNIDASFGAAFSGLAVTSPSVAIINSSGRLSYYGPYTDGLLCGQGQDMLSLVFDNLDRDPSYQWMNVLGFGCFCDWPRV